MFKLSMFSINEIFKLGMVRVRPGQAPMQDLCTAVDFGNA